METFSALLAICMGNSPVTGEFPAQRPVTRSFDAFFDLCLNKRLSKQSWGWRVETPSRSLWRHRNDINNDDDDKSDVSMVMMIYYSEATWPLRSWHHWQCYFCVTVCSGQHLSTALQNICGGNHWWPVGSPHEKPVLRKAFPYHDVIVYKFVSDRDNYTDHYSDVVMSTMAS